MTLKKKHTHFSKPYSCILQDIIGVKNLQIDFKLTETNIAKSLL